MPTRIDTVFFDLDGTLVDTAPDLSAALNRLLGSLDIPPLPAGRLRPHVSAGARGLIGEALGIQPGDSRFAVLRAKFLEFYEQALCEKSCLFEGIPAVLERYRAKDIRWGIVTNKPQRYAMPLIDALGLKNEAICIVCGDSATRPKPHPMPLWMACELSRTNTSNAVYVGDDPRDIDAGRSAGLHTIAAAWGYLGVGPPIEAWGAHAIAATPEDIVFG